MSKNKLSLLLGIMLLAQSCTVAKLSSCPTSSGEIDFNKCPLEIEANQSRRTSKTTNEYCIERATAYADEDILKAIDKAYKVNNFLVTKFNIPGKAVFAERGLRANEWNSIAAIYYQVEAGKTKIFILVKITQDATGGKRENRAQQIGLIIEKGL